MTRNSDYQDHPQPRPPRPVAEPERVRPDLVVVSSSSPPRPTELDVDELAGWLVTLVDLGRAISARASVAVIVDGELVFAGQRVEHLAGRVYAAIFGSPL